MYWQTSFIEIFIQKPLVVGKSSLFSGMSNDALIHLEGLKGKGKKVFLLKIGLPLHTLTLKELK